MTGTHRVVAALILVLCAVRAEAEVKITVAPQEGVYNMAPRPRRAPVPILVSASGNAKQVKVVLRASDIFGKPVGWERTLDLELPAEGKVAEGTVELDAGMGYFCVTATATSGGETAMAGAEIGVIPLPHPGIRKESFFASNTSALRTKDELKLLQAIGMKVERVHFQPEVAAKNADWAKTPSTGAALPLDFARQDKAWEETQQHDTWALPLAGYAFQGRGGIAKSELAEKLGMHGPPRNAQEFVNTWEQILRRYPEITTLEFWNEPWIFGWTWAATPQEYRDLQGAWCRMALKVNPNYRIIAGNSSMFVEDHIEPYPECWRGLLQGTTHHPYDFSCGEPNWRSGSNMRSLDSGMQVTRRMGLPYYYTTEGGTEYCPAGKGLPHGVMRNNIQNATKVVQYYVRQALIGAYQGNMQWDIGYGPASPMSNTAFAVMTNFLEDRPIVADIWPAHELIYGAIFANPKFITPEVKQLPRAQEISTRWNVPIPEDRADDTTRVAVIWSLTGASNSQLDPDGTLTIASADGLKAYDMTWREIPAREGGLAVPFTQNPVYITTDTLSVMDLRGRIATAKIEGVTPVNMYAMPLAKPADQPQDLRVRVENQMNRDVQGTLTLNIAGAQGAISAPFSARAAELIEVSVPWPGARVSPSNQYSITLTATTGDATTKRQQIIQVAAFTGRTVVVDGKMEDWAGTTPVLLDSGQVQQGVDLTEYYLNPHLERSTGTPEEQRIVARVYTAYDDKNVYIAAAVNEDKLSCTAGEPVVKGRKAEKVTLPYKNGMPDGLNFITTCGDSLQLAFGFRERVPGWGRQAGDPYYWKGHFYDTDYQYVAHTSGEGPKLIRLWGPDTPRRTAYQIDKVPYAGPVEGAQIAITRDEEKKLTVYELALPRTELALFDPAKGGCRFSFVLNNDEKLGVSGLNWGEAAGVFDHWYGCGSFGPSWEARVPCQTFWGIR